LINNSAVRPGRRQLRPVILQGGQYSEWCCYLITVRRGREKWKDSYNIWGYGEGDTRAEALIEARQDFADGGREYGRDEYHYQFWRAIDELNGEGN